MDIMKNFPNANELKTLASDGLYTYIFEQKLKTLRKKILFAAAAGKNKVEVKNIPNEIREFLTEQGYKVFKEREDTYKYNEFYVISWEN